MEISEFFDLLEWYLNESGSSVNALATASGVRQSQVWNWKNRKGVRYTKKAREVYKTIKKYRDSKDGEIPEQITAAVKEVWNGDKDQADAIAQLIKSLKPLVKKT